MLRSTSALRRGEHDAHGRLVDILLGENSQDHLLFVRMEHDPHGLLGKQPLGQRTGGAIED